MEALLEKVREEQYKNELENRTDWEIAGDIASETTGGLTRALIAGIDMGAMFVQGMIRTPRHPIEAWNGLVKSFKAGASRQEAKDQTLNHQAWILILQFFLIYLYQTLIHPCFYQLLYHNRL